MARKPTPAGTFRGIKPRPKTDNIQESVVPISGPAPPAADILKTGRNFYPPESTSAPRAKGKVVSRTAAENKTTRALNKNQLVKGGGATAATVAMAKRKKEK